MQVGIIELMDSSHVVLAETLCKIFCFDPHNKVFLFTKDKHANYLNFLCARHTNLSLIVKPPQQNNEAFLKEISLVPLDRIYIVTLTNYFPAFSRWQVKTKLFLVIHNLDDWFSISPFKSLRKFFYAIFHNPHSDLLFYSFKVNFIYAIYKNRILKNLRINKGCLVVLSQSVYKELIRLKIKMPIEVVPFAVFDPSFTVRKPSKPEKLRICVPGILSQYRRNYHSLLEILETQLSQYKNQFIIDFLGGVQSDNPCDDSKSIVEKANQLNRNGFSIIVHNVQIIPPLEYDQYLSQADIILGNMNVVLNHFSSYGRTKETGIPFTMIKAAKPGILPLSYALPEELRSSTLFYQDYSDLAEIIISLIKDPLIVMELSKKAILNSKHFSTEIIYNQLFSDNL